MARVKTGIFVVGLGGTGGLLVPKLAKILQGVNNIDLWLMDGDIVKKSNVQRQPYQEFNLNEKKAIALSRKVASNYNLNVYDFSDYLMGSEILSIAQSYSYTKTLILGCVDNHSTRMILENEHININNSFYVDSANGLNDGSIFITSSSHGEILGTLRSEVYPEIKTTDDHPSNTCGAEIAKGNTQQFVINDIMANSIAYIVNECLAKGEQTGVVKVDGFERIFIKD